MLRIAVTDDLRRGETEKIEAAPEGVGSRSGAR